MNLDKTKPIRTQCPTFILACFCFIALASTQCGRSSDRTSDVKPTITVLYPSDERVLGPYEDETPKFLVFLPLVVLNENGALEGRLAKSWEHSPDYRTWTIHLRTDVRWHDGVPVTAHDVKFTLDLLSHPEVLQESPDAYTVTVLDDSTYTITYNKRSLNPLDTWRIYYPKHLLEDLDPGNFESWEFWTHPVGNGPYRFVRHAPKTMMEFEANPDYYRGKPKIDRVVLKFGGSSLTELLSGNVDVLTYVHRMDLLRLAGDPRFRSYHAWPSHLWLNAIYWNHRHPLFRDPVIRRALTFAINRYELAKVLNYPDDVPLSDVIPTPRQLRQGLVPAPLPYDPQKAQRLLDEAGWRHLDGDGVRERAGEEFRFTAIVASRVSLAASLEKAAVYVQSQLRRVGVQMEIQALENSLAKRRLLAGEFEAAFYLFNSEAEHPFGPIRFLGEGSPISYVNPKVIEILNAAKSTMNPDERDRLYRELFPIFHADMPLTFLFPLMETHVAHRRIQGLSSPYRPDPVWFMEDLWLEEED